MRAKHLAVAAAVVALIAVAAVQHTTKITAVARVSHDDTISYLAATGHQGEYAQVVESGSAPVAQWVPAAQWQRFTRVEDALPLLRIAQDLGHYDIHPPVYFWLLHVWLLLVGVHLWSGPALNVLVHVATAVVLWRLARHVTRSPVAAWGAVGVWVSLPAVAETAVQARQYSLAALFSIALASAFIRTREAASVRGLIGVAACTALGLLTLYPFGLIVACLALFCAADLLAGIDIDAGKHLQASRRRTAFAQLGALAAGGVVFLLCQPWLRETLQRQQEQVEAYSPELSRFRVDVLLRDLPRFAVADLPAMAGFVVLIATAVLAVLAWRARPQARPVVALAVVVPLALSAAYIAVVTPGAASQARYFSIALPHVALLPVLAWPYLKVKPVLFVAAAAFVAAVVINTTLAISEAGTPPATVLDGDRPVVMDNLARGVLLRILWDAPPQTPVYAADQQTLLNTTDRWLRCTQPSPCHQREVTLATQVQYEATELGQLQILSAAEEVRDVTPEPPLDDVAQRYRLSAPTTGAVAGTSSAAGVIHTGS
jgi:hypothetical protein